jgi:type IV pilus assembly protein PilA
VEVLIVVIILGILAAIVLAAVGSPNRDANNAAFVGNLKHFARAFTLYQEKYGAFPPDALPGVLPPGMEEFADPQVWANARPLGGQWDWDFQQFGFTAGVSVFMPTRTDADMVYVDRLVDDGDLNTGSFQKRAQGYILVLQP